MLEAGGDCTDLFNEKHAWVNCHGMLEKCYVGDIDATSIENSSKPKSTSALDIATWKSFKLLEKKKVSAMTKLFRFELPSKKKLGFEMPGQHLMVRAEINGVIVQRAYTPVSGLNQKGTFDLLIKIYPDGLMSSYIDSLEPGEEYLEMIGPKGAFGYIKPGVFQSGSLIRSISHLGMVAGGSGITPMLQLIRAILENREDLTTTISLIYCNHTKDNIIAGDQLEPLLQFFPRRFKMHYVLTGIDAVDQLEPSSDMKKRNLVSSSLDLGLMQKVLPSPDDEGGVCILHCGPPKFDIFVHEALIELDFTKEQIHSF